MTNIKHKLGKRLFGNYLLLILFIILIGVAGLIVINILKQTSEEVVFEYKELEVLNSLRNSYNKTYIPAYNFLIYQQEEDLIEFQHKIDQTKKDLEICYAFLHKRHKKELLEHFNMRLLNFEHIIKVSKIYEKEIYKNRVLIKKLDDLLTEANSDIETLLEETKKEVDKYIIVNKTASYHSSVTIIILFIVVSLIGYIFVFRFIKRLSSPLKELVDSTNEVMKGNLSTRTNISTNDELELLGNSFNKMVESLNQTTVSKNYFDNILSSMYESIIVSDNNGDITMVNSATCTLLAYEEEMKGQNISRFFLDKEGKDINFSFNSLLNKKIINNVERKYLSKNKEQIPVLFSCSLLKNSQDEYKGVVFVAHDIRERKKIQDQIESIRKRHLIDINEAEEKERLRIAGEIHDGLGVILTDISYYLENNFNEKYNESDEINLHIGNIQKKLDHAISESKIIAHDLIPILLKDFGLVTAIENHVSLINKQNKTEFKFTAFNFKDRLDEKLEKMLFRVVQESSNNILKHAKAEQAQIQLIKHDESVSLIVTDDGIGFNYDQIMKETKNRGIGLISIRERVLSFDGEISVNSVSNDGTEIVIEIPLNLVNA